MNLTFLNPAFLFAALAALLPLVIHMLSRRQVKTVDFSSLMFLKELERRKVRRVRIRQILLLIVRSLIILCAALALARPTLSGFGGASSRARTSVAIVLDTSASTARRSEAGELFERVRARALEIADLLGDGDEAFLVTADAPPRDLVPGGTYSVDVLRQAINEASPTRAATDYRAAVARSLDLLAGSRNLNRELYVVGDMQGAGWTAGEPTEAPATGEPRIFLLPVEGVVGNRSVASVRVERRYGAPSGEVDVWATVSNDGTTPVDIPVRLVIDEVSVGQSGTSLEPGTSSDVSFSTRLDETSWHAGRIELPADALAVDNVRHFVVPPSRSEEVLIVNRPNAPEDDDAYYIRRALDPAGTRDPFSCVEIPSTALRHQEHGRFGVVVIADVGRLDPEAERWLLTHLDRRGGVAVVLGEMTDVRYWNELLVEELGAGMIVEPVERRSGFRIAPAGVGHALLSGLVFGERLIDDATATRAFRAETGASDVVLELPGVGPLLALTTPERGGRAAIVYTGLAGVWSDLPRSGLFVPVMHRVAAWLSGDSRSGSEAEVGEDLIVPYDPARSDAPQVTLPTGETVRAERIPGAGAAALRAVEHPGVYRFGDEGGEVSLAVVNVPAVESDLAPAGREELDAALGGRAWTRLSEGDELADAILVARHGRELWRVFVYAALALIAFEMWIARPRF